MKGKILLIVFVLLVLFVIPSISADFNPDSSINMHEYDIHNATYLNSTYIYMNGTLVSTSSISDTNCSESGSCTEIIYWDNESTLNASMDAKDTTFNDSIKDYSDGQDSSYNTSMATYVLAVNGTMKTYVLAVNTTMGTYVLAVNGTMATYVLAVNSTMKDYTDGQDSSYNTSMATYVLAVNGTMKTYVLAVNTTMATYVLAVNATMKTYAQAVNATMKIWADAQDSLYNSTLKAYLDAQDAVFNNSVVAWVNGLGYKTLTEIVASIGNWSADKDSYVPYTGATSNLDLGNNNFSVATSVLFVDKDGYVGVGTINPSYELDVNGDIHADGEMIVDSTLTAGGAYFDDNIFLDSNNIEEVGQLIFQDAGAFFIPRNSTSDNPTVLVGELIIWRDTDDSKTYLVYNDTDEGVNRVELTTDFNIENYYTKTEGNATYVSRFDWTTNDNYPTTCSGATPNVQAIGDTLTCRADLYNTTGEIWAVVDNSTFLKNGTLTNAKLCTWDATSGIINCTTEASAWTYAHYFDQDLNTTDNVTFVNVTVGYLCNSTNCYTIEELIADTTGGLSTDQDAELNTTGGPSFVNVTLDAIYGTGDTDTYINWSGSADQLEFFAGGLSMIHLVETDGGDTLVFNQDSNDIDFRVETDDNLYTLVIDGGTDSIRFGALVSCDTISSDATGILSCGYSMDQDVETTDAPEFATINTGIGNVEAYAMNQNVSTTDGVTFATVDTGEGANELFNMNQDVESSDAVTFITLDTGEGANELFDMDQNVLEASGVTFATVDTGQGANELYDMDQNVLTTSNVVFNDTISNAYHIGDDEAYYAGNSDDYKAYFNGTCWIQQVGTTQDIICP